MPDPAAPEAFSSVHTASFAALLESFGASLLVTTFQAGRVIVMRPQGTSVNITSSRCRGRWGSRPTVNAFSSALTSPCTSTATSRRSPRASTRRTGKTLCSYCGTGPYLTVMWLMPPPRPDQRGSGFPPVVGTAADIGAIEGVTGRDIPVPALGPWLVAALSALLGVLGLRRRRTP